MRYLNIEREEGSVTWRHVVEIASHLIDWKEPQRAADPRLHGRQVPWWGSQFWPGLLSQPPQQHNLARPPVPLKANTDFCLHWNRQQLISCRGTGSTPAIINLQQFGSFYVRM